MTDLSLILEDSKAYRVVITDDKGAPIDLTDAIVKFTVRHQANRKSKVVIFKATYDDDEVLIDDPANGRLLVFVETFDTHGQNAGCFAWDIETNRRNGLKSSAGAITVQAGSGLMAGTGIDFSAVKPGFILVPTGATAANQKQVTIIDVGGSGLPTDPGVGNLLTDYTGWDNEAAIPIQVYKNNRKTPKYLSGKFTIEDQVSV